MSFAPRWWSRPSVWSLLLTPLAGLFGALVWLRRWLYQHGILPSTRLPVPVIIVGNLTVGGSGKTPLVLYVLEQLRAQGFKPGIISRGYGGNNARSAAAQAVFPDSLAPFCGDEPLLLAQRSAAPVFIGRDRVAAGQALLAAHPECNVLISDDGLQHYRLQRSVEIAVFDARGAMNQRLLPQGPLREPLSRLLAVDALVWNTGAAPRPALGVKLQAPQFSMRLLGERFVALNQVQGIQNTEATEAIQAIQVTQVTAQQFCSADDLRAQTKRLYAIAGMGNPSRFFDQLNALGLSFTERAFPDHYAYTRADLAFAEGGILLMTEKDAVKCAALWQGKAGLTCTAWFLPITAQLDLAQNGRSLLATILEKL